MSCYCTQELTITECTGTEVQVEGFLYEYQVTKSETQPCSFIEAVFTSCDYTEENPPRIGDTAIHDEISYLISSVQFAACTLVLSLARPVLDCPDCLATVVRVYRAPGEDCPTEVFATDLATDVPISICEEKLETQIVNDAEVCTSTVKICFGANINVRPGDFVQCEETTYVVDSIETRCDVKQLAQVVAREAPFGWEDRV
jgi:hypothetical protein